MPGVLDDPARAAAAAAAVDRLAPGMTVGLGSGRAVFAVVQAAADRWAARWPAGPPLRAVVASSGTQALASSVGIELVGLDELGGDGRLDLAIDGADEVDPTLGLIKGGGAALLREKLVFAAASYVLIVAEEPKLVPRLGQQHPLPVEVVRFGWTTTRRRLLDLVGEATRRTDATGAPFVTDEGHYLLDCRLPDTDLAALAAAVKATLGVVEHGLFLGVADEVLLGRADGSLQVLRRSGARRQP